MSRTYGVRPVTDGPWWAAGLGTVEWIGPQLVIAFLEGSAGPGEDYTDVFRGSSAPVVEFMVSVASGLAGYA